MALSDCAPHTTSKAEQVDALFAPYTETPGAAVAVVKGGKIELVKGYGLADVQARKPITPDTAFDLASDSKPFTAASILLLAEKGKLGLDDRLCKTCPAFSGPPAGITIRQLLNHTSGMPDYLCALADSGRLPRLASRPSTAKPFPDEPTAAEIVKLLAKAPQLDFAPGSRFDYSNSGYVVLGQVAERASGQRLSEFLKESIFAKLGMAHTVLVDERKQAVAARAHSYRTATDTVDMDYTAVNCIYGDGNVNSTARDMASWLMSLDNCSVLSRDSLRQSWTPATLLGGSTTDYGFGWVLGDFRGEQSVGHDGAWVGFQSSVLYVPNRRLGVVVLSNLETLPIDDLTAAIADIYAEQ